MFVSSKIVLNCNKNIHLCRNNIRLISNVINPEPVITIHQRLFTNLNKQITKGNSTTNLLKTFSSTGKVYCSTKVTYKIATYDEVKDIPNHPDKLLIDVREPKELKDTGIIPGSINIPLGDVKSIFASNTSTKEFLAKFGRAKPAHNDKIIFFCRAGVRSQTALDIVTELGFTNGKSYKGSWIEWAEKNGLKVD